MRAQGNKTKGEENDDATGTKRTKPVNEAAAEADKEQDTDLWIIEFKDNLL